MDRERRVAVRRPHFKRPPESAAAPRSLENIWEDWASRLPTSQARSRAPILAVRQVWRYDSRVKRRQSPGDERLTPHLSGLFGYALSLCGNREDARDLVQNCALKAFTAHKVPSDAPAYRTWLFRILRNVFIDEVRSKSAFALCIESFAESQPDAFRYEESLINSLTLKRGMQALSLEHREIIGLVDMAGFTYEEAAQLIGIPTGTVMSRLSRARKYLLRTIHEDNVRTLPVRSKGVRN